MHRMHTDTHQISAIKTFTARPHLPRLSPSVLLKRFELLLPSPAICCSMKLLKNAPLSPSYQKYAPCPSRTETAKAFTQSIQIFDSSAEERGKNLTEILSLLSLVAASQTAENVSAAVGVELVLFLSLTPLCSLVFTLLHQKRPVPAGARGCQPTEHNISLDG